MQPAIDFVNARSSSVVIEELPSYLDFFINYVASAQAISTSSVPSLLMHTDRIFSTILGCRPRARPRHPSPSVIVLLYRLRPRTSITPDHRNSFFRIIIHRRRNAVVVQATQRLRVRDISDAGVAGCYLASVSQVVVLVELHARG